ncbi:MAG: hypothetical protein ABGX22_28090 [Pirellulaceae bacterium]|nr:hypothetical protein [Planctomycetaceae bacterium]
MNRNPLTIAPTLCLLLGSLLTPAVSSRVVADEFTEAVAAIEKIGGSVRPVGDTWDVDFHLRGRGLTDNGLVHVAALKNIVWLNLSNTKITDAGLGHLKNLKKLRWLHLEKTEIGDEAIGNLASLPNLEYLNLYATKITDKSLERLRGCTKLKRLYVWQTDVTDSGVARLEKRLPELTIVRGVDLSKLAALFPAEVEPTKPKLSLKWIAVSSRFDAPQRSENGINCQIWFENKSKNPVKLQWISYGSGELQFYATLAPGTTRQQNSYSRNAWLITDEDDQPLGYFVAKDDDSLAVIPSQK